MFDSIDSWYSRLMDRKQTKSDTMIMASEDLKGFEAAYEQAIKDSRMIPTSYDKRLNAHDPNDIELRFVEVDSPFTATKLKIYRNVVDITMRLNPMEYIPLMSSWWEQSHGTISNVKLLMSRESWIFLFNKLHHSFLSEHYILPTQFINRFGKDVSSEAELNLYEFRKLVYLFNEALCNFDWECRHYHMQFLPNLLLSIRDCGPNYLSNNFTRRNQYINMSV